MAKKVEDLQRYWQEMATKFGVPEDRVQAFGEFLGDEAVVKAFKQGFIPVSEHHSTLDEFRSEAEADRRKLTDWYNNEALPAYRSNLAGIERLRQYEQAYGDLREGTPQETPSGSLGFRSKDEFDQYINDKLRAQQNGMVGLAKVTPKISLDYYQRFGKVLDLDEVEKISIKNGVPPEVAYSQYIAPMVEEKQKEEFTKQLKEAEERGARNALSQHNLPTDTGPRESSVFFDREAYTEKAPATPFEAERVSHNEFLQGWNSYEEGMTGKS